MRNLYDILGVHTTATLADIRAAYRQKCRQHHPDAGGTREGFEEISIAHETLTDTDARAFYDQTGQIKGRKLEGVDNAEMYNYVTQLFEGVMSMVDDPTAIDIVTMMKRQAKENVRNARRELESMKTRRNKLERTRSRIKVKDGENFFAKLIDGQMHAVTARIDGIESAVASMERATEFLHQYSFEVDKNASPDARYTSFKDLL